MCRNGIAFTPRVFRVAMEACCKLDGLAPVQSLLADAQEYSGDDGSSWYEEWLKVYCGPRGRALADDHPLCERRSMDDVRACLGSCIRAASDSRVIADIADCDSA
jgi:hypothetical protein